jgi:hypothetical protein
MTGPLHETITEPPRRADYGQTRFSRRDIDGLILTAETDRQVTVHAEITESTLRAVQDILDPTRDGFNDTCPDQPEPEPVGHLTNTPRAIRESHPLVAGGGRPGPGARTGGQRGH